MPLTMRILGWKAEGLRCPDHEVDCCGSDGNPAKVSLIQMPNGTGKTTTLTLLRAALSGQGTDWNSYEIKELQKKSSPSTDGIFELRLALNEKRVTMIMEFDFTSGSIEYKTTWGSGQEVGFAPPSELKRFMSPEFVNFYVFDGELADNLLSRDHTDAEMAVESLFQVHLLSRMQKRVDEYWDERTRNITAKDQTGHTRRRNQLKLWQDRLRLVKNQRDECKRQLTRTRSDLVREQGKYKLEIRKEEERARLFEAAEHSVIDLKAEVREKSKGVMEDMRDPHALSSVFATAIFELKAGLDRVKLPESAAREFFEELAEANECVCGRVIDDQIRQQIRQRSERYMGSDDIMLLNAVKSAIADAVGGSRSNAADELTESITTLSTRVTQLQLARNELDELGLAAAQADPDVKKTRAEIERLEQESDNLERKLSTFEGRDEGVKFDRISNVNPAQVASIETIEDVIRILEIRVAEATKTAELRRKRDVLKVLLESAFQKARSAIAENIRDEANQRIGQLMPHNDIRIDQIDGCLVLNGQSGGSVGENLSVGYAFLSTLFDRAEHHQLPFVVDSPASPIDLDIRPKIGSLVPKLSGQFIAFMISSERDKFLPSLIETGDGDMQFITLFRKGVEHYETRAMQVSSCVATEDGLLVSDEQFFNDFQLDQEDL